MTKDFKAGEHHGAAPAPAWGQQSHHQHILPTLWPRAGEGLQCVGENRVRLTPQLSCRGTQGPLTIQSEIELAGTAGTPELYKNCCHKSHSYIHVHIQAAWGTLQEKR